MPSNHTENTIDNPEIGTRYNQEELTDEEIEEIINNATGTIEKHRLINTQIGFWVFETEMLSKDPVINYLYTGEELHFLFEFSGIHSDLKIYDNSDTPKEIESDRSYFSFVVFTDKRILIIVGQKDGDEFVSIPFKSIMYVNIDKAKLQESKIKIGTYNQIFEIELTKSNKVLKNLEDFLHSKEIPDKNPNTSENIQTITLCRKCQEQISPEAEKCPHCGFSPTEKKKGKLWWGGTAALSTTLLAPVGVAMAAKGTKDHIEARESVGESTHVPANDTELPESDKVSKLERLSDLREKGTITDEEFEELKDDLLD